MKFNFKKIASVLASVAMLGSSVAIAGAANYPAPFVSGGSADVAIVVTSGTHIGASSDYLAAVDLGQDLQAELAKQTATTGTSTGATASGGDSANLATSSQKLWFNSTVDTARTVLSKSELPTLLADGEVEDDSGTSYTYSQSIDLGSKTIEYSTSGADFDDPDLVVEVGTSADSYLYKYSLTFNKNINVTHSDVRGNDIEILGTKYTIASGSNGAASTPVVVLYGSGETKTLNEGDTITVNIGGTDHEVTLSAITDGYAHVSIDGSSAKKIAEDSSSKIGDIEIYVKSVTYSAKETTQNAASLVLGTKKLKLEQGQSVKEGSDETTILGTRAGVSTSGGLVSGINITIAMQKATKDYIKAGETFEDPVFGNLQVNFVGVTPSLDDDSRDVVKVTTDNALNARVTFTTALADKEYTLSYNKDQDTSESTVTPRLATSANKTIHIIENESIKVNEYVIINSGDYGRIMYLSDVPGQGQLSATSKIQFVDAVTGENVLGSSGLTVGTSGQSTTNINGQPYYFKLDPTNDSVRITWGSGATYGSAGNAITISPRIKLKNGEWLAILDRVTGLDNNTVYSLPGIETLSTYEAGKTLSAAAGGINNESSAAANSTRYVGAVYGNINYTLYVPGNRTDAIELIGISTNNADAPGATNYCSFNATYGPAILLIEEKKTTESGNSDNGDIICIASDLSGTTTPVEISIATPIATGIWGSGTAAKDGLATLSSDTYIRRGVTRYGTFIEYTSKDNDGVTIKYPNEQMYVDILFKEASAVVTSGSSGTGSVLELGSVTVKDSEVSQVEGNNLIVIGGSCINDVASNILNGARCGQSFTDATGVSSGQFLIKVVDSPYTTGKIAMLVAGYEAADTAKAVKYLTTDEVSTDVGTELKKETATYADVV